MIACAAIGRGYYRDSVCLFRPRDGEDLAQGTSTARCMPWLA